MNLTDMLIMGINIGLISFFTFSISFDLKLVYWHEYKKNAYIERLVKERMELNSFDFT